jgi:hypothetical protein
MMVECTTHLGTMDMNKGQFLFWGSYVKELLLDKSTATFSKKKQKKTTHLRNAFRWLVLVSKTAATRKAACSRFV